MARGRACPPKSRGRCQLCDFSLPMQALQSTSAASFHRADLRRLLGRSAGTNPRQFMYLVRRAAERRRFALCDDGGRVSDNENLCHLCERARPEFQLAVAYGEYEGTLRALIHLLKYEHIPTIAEPLGSLLAGTIARRQDLPPGLTVVAVPLHGSKQRERGFNQTILLAEATVRSLRWQRPDLALLLAFDAMGRQRATETQAGLTPHQRRRNLRGAFFVRQPEKVAGHAMLLLDDIYTTGATARECTRTLLGAGALSVHVATLARSQREGVAFWDAVGAGSRMNVAPLSANRSMAVTSFRNRD